MVRLMLVLGLVLSLAACGGSRTDGLSMSEEDTLEARLEAAEAERDQAEADKAAAEADKAAAEADKAAAEADKAAAEAEKVAAEADKVAAEADKAAAEADKVAAEADKVAAEADKVAAEADKAVAEADKVAAEADKAAAEADKAIAEAERDQAEADKAAAEADKAIAEAERDQAEADKAAAEADKAIAEAERDQAETDKAAAEAEKAIAEAARDQAEAARDQAEAARDQAEAERDQAEADKAVAEADKGKALAEAQYQLREAVRARQEAADARQEAADARQEAADARGEAETARQETETAQQAQERLAAERDEARQKALQLEAADALTGLGTLLDAPDVNAKYRAPAIVTPTDVTFTSPSGSSAGRWYATTAHSRGQTTEDTVVVYSDVAAPKRTAITQAPAHRTRNFTEDGNFLVFPVAASDSNLIASSSSLFPTGGLKDTIDLTVDTSDPPDDPLDDAAVFEQTARIGGRFDGASGTFQCTGSGATACSVRHTGAGYVLGDGAWTFRTSKTSKVDVPDDNFMYFGWWRQKTISGTDAGTFAYGLVSMTTGPPVFTGGDFNTLAGSATYEGPAIGQYAISQSLGTQSNHGEFKATARFTANFDDNELSGSVSGFSGSGFDVNPGWSLTLKVTDMPSGRVADGDVSWTIDGNTQDGGAWKGAFHSEIEDENGAYPGQIPEGLTGTFEATYNDVGRLRGAYGATVK